MIEKQCECCKEFWYADALKCDLCPNCYDFLLKNNILLLKRIKYKILKEKRNLVGCCFINEKPILKILNKEINNLSIKLYEYYDIYKGENKNV